MSKVKKSRVKLLHQYYKYTGFYSFIWQGVKGAILPTAVIGSLLFSFVSQMCTEAFDHREQQGIKVQISSGLQG